MNITTLMCGSAKDIREEFRREVDLIYYNVSDMEREVGDVADDLRETIAGMVTALCHSTARNFRITQDVSGYQTLVVWKKGLEGLVMSADAVEFVRTFLSHGEAWEILARILTRGDSEMSGMDGNQVWDLRYSGVLDIIIDSLDDPGTVTVLDSEEHMHSVSPAFARLFGGSEIGWEGLGWPEPGFQGV